jgi:L-alanine-DL-glutamate epimerase-like enolase superfamily enzyme
MTLRIERITVHLVEMKLGFTYSSGTLECARALIWEIAAGGAVGLGECGFSGERSVPGMAADLGGGTAPGLKQALARWVEPLVGRNALELEALLEPLPPVVDWDRLVIREGLSIALHDLVGQACGVPVHTLLGGRRRNRFPGMPVVHVGPADVMVRRALKWTGAGYRFLKIKFRGRLGEDVEALQGIRQAVGEGVALVVDANDGYKTVDEAAGAIDALKPCRIDYFEDMLNAPNEAIAELRRRTGCRIMVDRQATWPHIHEVVRAGAADVINHHPDNQGGLATALQIDAVARAAGLETAIGSSGVFGIQDAAFMQLACVIGLTRPCEDIGMEPYAAGPCRGEYAFDGPPDVIRRPYPIVDGLIAVPDAPGLGVELDPDALKRLLVDRIAFP